MSLVFEALQNLEAERYGVFRPSPPEEAEMLRCVERRIVPNRGTLPMGPDVEVHADEPAKLFSVPSPEEAPVVSAAASVVPVAVAAPYVPAPYMPAPYVPAPVNPFAAAGAAAASAAPAITVREVSVPEKAVQETIVPEKAVKADTIRESTVQQPVVREQVVAESAIAVKAAAAAPVEAEPKRVSTRAGRTLEMLRMALPLVENALNQFGGQKGAAVAKLLGSITAPAPKAQPVVVAPAPPVDLGALTNGLTAITNEQRELRAQVAEQNNSLLRIEGQLEHVREATHRNTMEQKELIEDLRGVGSKINVVAAIGLGLLAASVAVNLVLYLHLIKVL